MEIKTIEMAGFAGALSALRLPFGKEERSDINFYTNRGSVVGFVDESTEGNERTTHVSFTSDIWINGKDLDLMSTLVKRGDEHAKVTRGIIVFAKITAPIYWWCELETYRAGHERLASSSTMHIDCRGLSGEALQEAKASIPMGKELTKVDFFSYQCLRNMYRQRYNHRLQEWHSFCDWIKDLPFAEELILSGLDIKEEAGK